MTNSTPEVLGAPLGKTSLHRMQELVDEIVRCCPPARRRGGEARASASSRQDPHRRRSRPPEHFEFHNKTLAGQKEQKQRWKRVLGTINQSAGEAMGQLYVDVAFPPSSKARMEELVANLGQALKVRIENLPSMSDATKLKALEKLATFTPKIGYPDQWRDWTGLATQPTSYVENVLSARAFNYRWELGKIGKPVDKTEWDMPPQMVNAYYNPLQNEIVFPAGILHPPFFDPHGDDALNYGAMDASTRMTLGMMPPGRQLLRWPVGDSGSAEWRSCSRSRRSPPSSSATWSTRRWWRASTGPASS